MSRDSAERAVITSALVVAIIYAYRRLQEPAQSGATVKRLAGVGAPVNFSAWATAWGTVFFMLSIVSEFAPGPAGAFAILTAVSDTMVNGTQLFSDLGQQTTPTPTTSTPKTGQNTTGAGTSK